MIRKLLLSTAFAALATASIAADLPNRKAPEPFIAPAPIFSWTGFYVGAVGGYGWTRITHCDGVGPACVADRPQHSVNGFTIGGTVGFNYQMGNVVLGAEGDYSWAGLKGSAPSTGAFTCGGGICSTEIEGIGTLRARLGYSMGRFLPYITGGAAFVRYDVRHAASVRGFSDFRTQFVAGAGAEYAFTNNWSAKAEYLHVFKTSNINYDPTVVCTPPGCVAKTRDIGLLRVGVNYRF